MSILAKCKPELSAAYTTELFFDLSFTEYRLLSNLQLALGKVEKGAGWFESRGLGVCK